jgi:hypothetical protein
MHRLPPFIGNLHPNIKVVYPPPHTTSLIQLMDQEFTATFKVCYLTKTFAQAIAASEKDIDAILEGLQHLRLYQE